jgi:hypothetical protein
MVACWFHADGAEEERGLAPILISISRRWAQIEEPGLAEISNSIYFVCYVFTRICLMQIGAELFSGGLFHAVGRGVVSRRLARIGECGFVDIQSGFNA